MEPIFLIIILGFIVFAGWYFIWPRKSKEETIVPIPHEPIFQRASDLPQKVKYNALQRVSSTRENIGIGDHPLLSYRNFELKRRCEKKILDLQNLLARHGKEGFELAPNDLIRYKAMIEVLKAMIN